MTGPDRIRLRIRFSKVGKIRWTSHRDVARMWERAFRRVRLPLAYSEGFSPRPRISFGLALSTGHESVAEYLDVEVSDFSAVDLTALPSQLSGALPVGVDAATVAVLEPGSPSLQEDVLSCTWVWQAVAEEAEGADGAGRLDPASMAEKVEGLLAAPVATITRTRKGSEVTEDVRPGIHRLVVVSAGRLAESGPPAETGTGDGVWLEAELAASPRAVRPADVMRALGFGLEERHVRRTHQWILRHGARQEPLPGGPRPGAPEAPHALERAS